MDVREIIARAYDREESAQMGESDPWTDPEPVAEEVSERLACAQCVIEALGAAGYRIVSGLDPETLEAAARAAEAIPPMRQISPDHVKAATPQYVAAAIRALNEGREQR